VKSLQVPSNVLSRMKDPSWTLGRRDIVEAFSNWERFSENDRRCLLSKLGKLDGPAARKALNSLETLAPRWRAELVRSVLKSALKTLLVRENGQDSDVDSIREAVLDHLKDPLVRIRKSAAQAVGSSWGFLNEDMKQDILSCMKEALKESIDPSETKALVEALGHSGDRAALEFLQNYNVLEGQAPFAKAVIKLTRDLAHATDEKSESVNPEALTVTLPVISCFTPGIEKIALKTQPFIGSQRIAEGVLLSRKISWSELKTNFLWRKSGFLLGEIKTGTPREMLDMLMSHSEALIKASGSMSNLPIRVRLARSHLVTRSFVWDFASQLSEARCALINDGRDPHWQLEIFGKLLVLFPRKYADERFAWRNSQVEGASDPTVAAAIVQLAHISPQETVYDPFCGAATELILASKISNAKKLIGTDLSQGAIEAAEKALKTTRVNADLYEADALCCDIKNVQVVISNPPFGMRTARGKARDVLSQLFCHLYGKLTSGGRIVILSHAPSSTRRWAADAGYDLKQFVVVKLGRMECEIQSFVRNH
jgi:predicted RNA methylase